jgi:glycosyltransferase involved in cell wall biosynthesis
MTMTTPLSVLIMTMNEERNIGACLDGVVGWASDIVVVDSGSTDRTLAICAERGIPTRFHAYVDHPSQMRWSMASIPWRHDWLLVLDADRVVTPELRHEIDEMLRGDSGVIHGFYNPHVQYFRQRPVRGLKTHYLQLVRRARARVDESELVDGRLIVDGPTGTLRGAIIESNQNELDVDFWIDKHQKYARRIAIEEILRDEQLLSRSEGVRPRLLGNADERMVWLKHVWFRMPLYVRPVLFFFYRYVLRLGFLDGWNGFVFHAFQAFWFRLLVDVNIAEYRRRLKQNTLSLEQLLEVADRTPARRTAATDDRVVECQKP